MTPSVETVVLPLSGWVFQWRDDGCWRDLNSAQYRAELAGEHIPRDDDWVRWTGTLYRQGRGGSWSAAPEWRLIYDELPPGRVPHVLLADGAEPPVVMVGGIWMCEWVSPPQAATVTVGDESWEVPPRRRPDYLPPVELES